jgi:glycyl-tRNA synthetase beta subunit
MITLNKTQKTTVLNIFYKLITGDLLKTQTFINEYGEGLCNDYVALSKMLEKFMQYDNTKEAFADLVDLYEGLDTAVRERIVMGFDDELTQNAVVVLEAIHKERDRRFDEWVKDYETDRGQSDLIILEK